jgi:hypothetical protein
VKAKQKINAKRVPRGIEFTIPVKDLRNADILTRLSLSQRSKPVRIKETQY